MAIYFDTLMPTKKNSCYYKVKIEELSGKNEESLLNSKFENHNARKNIRHIGLNQSYSLGHETKTKIIQYKSI